VNRVAVAGGDLRVHTRAGSGPALILLHYWGGSHRTWDLVVDALSSHHVVTYDQRGWGEARLVTGPYGLDQLADDVLAVAAALGLDEYVLVGHSMGGKVAQLVAARRPAELRGLVLVAPAPPVPAALTSAQQDVLAHAYDDADAVDRSIDHVLTKAGLDQRLRTQVVADSLSADDDARRVWPYEGIVSDISGAVASIEVPVRVLAGGDDGVEPPELLADQLLPYVPGATMQVIAGTGHLSPLEVPGEIASQIGSFVASLR
jgi:pimeloyl-ACP methyl ester carboxylesterase